LDEPWSTPTPIALPSARLLVVAIVEKALALATSRGG
jgi:hypothetical protein